MVCAEGKAKKKEGKKDEKQNDRTGAAGLDGRTDGRARAMRVVLLRLGK